MRKQVVLAATALALAVATFASAPFATASFQKRDDKTGKTVPIIAANLNDDVCIDIRDVSTPDGDHSLRMVIYDGAANEVYQSISTITAAERKWGRYICYGFNENHDRPGTWWYVAELDNDPLFDKQIQVGPAK
jgi:hypothetical protein